MQFVPLPGGRAWVSVWETRVSDYAAFAAATTNGWHAAWFQETTNHPAVEVRWDEAEAFCAWLSQRERASGLLGANEGYRLPTSDEWTSSLGQAQDGDPSTIPGNFGPALKSDSFPHTSEVGTFQSNALGLYDLRGNVWEWCTAWPSEEGVIRILRGGGWRDHVPELLASGSAIARGPACHRRGLRVSMRPRPQAATPAGIAGCGHGPKNYSQLGNLAWEGLGCPVHWFTGGSTPSAFSILKLENDAYSRHPDRFVDRHIGPRQKDIETMLSALGHDSLDAMISAGVPNSIRTPELPEVPPAQSETEAHRVAPQLGRAESGLAHVHRAGLLQLHHPAGDPAKPPREPRLVHAVHAVSGRDFAGPA